MAPITPPRASPSTSGSRPAAAARPRLGSAIITGSALLVLVGVAAAMGASPVAVDRSDVRPSAPIRRRRAPGPGRQRRPECGSPNGTTPDHAGPMGGPMSASVAGSRGSASASMTSRSPPSTARSLSLKTDDGWTRTIAVTDSTTITKGGATISLGDLAVGDSDPVPPGAARPTAPTPSRPSSSSCRPSSARSPRSTATPSPSPSLGGTTATIHVDSGTTYRLAGGPAPGLAVRPQGRDGHRRRGHPASRRLARRGGDPRRHREG